MKNTFAFILGASLILYSQSALTQNLSSQHGTTSLGAGVGLPYGGLFGLRLNHQVIDYFSIFGGAGYNLLGLGLNGGLNYTIPSSNSTEFYFTGMYGYNAVINIKNLPAYQNNYYGVSLGTGIKLNSLRHEGRYWDFGVLVPVRNSQYREDINFIKNNPSIELNTAPGAILIFFGYNFPISAKK